MVDSLPVILTVGTFLGFLTGLGIGGGSLLILWLTIVLDMEPGVARGINLLFFIPSAVISCLFRWKQGKLQWKPAIPAIAAGCASAVVFTCLSTVLDTALLKKLFGLVLLAAGMREILFRQPRTKN